MPHNFIVGQLVLLDVKSFLHKNTKLAPNWSGPHKIVRLKHDNNVELKENWQKFGHSCQPAKTIFRPIADQNIH